MYGACNSSSACRLSLLQGAPSLINTHLQSEKGQPGLELLLEPCAAVCLTPKQLQVWFEPIMRLKKNCTYCPEWSERCWDQQLWEKIDGVSPLGCGKFLCTKTKRSLGFGGVPPRTLGPAWALAGGRIHPCPSPDGLRGEHGVLERRRRVHAASPRTHRCESHVLKDTRGTGSSPLQPNASHPKSHAEGRQNQHSRKAMTDSTFSMGFRRRGFHLCTRLCLSAIALSRLSSRYLGTLNSDQ